MNVLSLFDGMSCGQIALNKAGIKYKTYIASEIDKYAIKITQVNYPNTIQVGDVTKFKVNEQWFDLILAGSPCQGLSKAGKGLGLQDPRSKLFFEFVRILHEAQAINPDVKFLLENVEMPHADELTISKILGIHPIKINSSLTITKDLISTVLAQESLPIVYNHEQEKAQGGKGHLQNKTASLML